MGNRNLLVIEGADCMGKTTLVGQLQEALKWPSLHTGGPKTNEQLEEGMRRVEAINSSYLIDRLPLISEIAYRPISRDGDMVPIETQWIWINRVAELSPVIIFCRTSTLPHLVAVERPHKSFEYWAKVQAGYQGIVDRYDFLIENLKSRTPVFVYDWTDPEAYGKMQAFVQFHFGFDEVL